MINNYKAVSSRYLKHNKKRTILTILGIIMSIALMCSIGTLEVSMKDSMYNQKIQENGNYEASVMNNISKDQLSKIKDIKEIESIAVESDKLAENSIKNKQIKLASGDNNLLNALNVKVIEGSLPTKPKEIILEEWILKYFDKKPTVGEELKLILDGKEVPFKIVGIAKSKSGSENLGVATAYVFNDKLTADLENTQKYIKLKDDSDKKETIDEISAILGKDKVIINEDILLLTDESSQSVENTVMLLMGVILAIIIVTSTSIVIYNSFNISIADRTKQLGQLRAMGATKKQIKSLVIREASIMTLISIPIGMILGLGGVYFIIDILNVINPEIDLKITFSFMVMIASAIVGVLAVFISVLRLAKFASKISPLAAISNSTLISKDDIKRGKKSPLSKYLKIDKVMAIKNIKRNKKRFYTTAISIAISVTLFISCVTFYKAISHFEPLLPGQEKYNFGIVASSMDEYVLPEVYDLPERIKEIPGVNDVYTVYADIDLKAIVDEDNIPEIIKEQNYNFISNVTDEGNSKEAVTVTMSPFEDNRFKALKDYVIEGSVDNLKDNEVIITRNEKILQDKTTVVSPVINAKVGDEIKIDPNYSKNKWNKDKAYKEGELVKFKVAAVVEKVPFYVGREGTQKIILKKNSLEKIIANNQDAKSEMRAFSLEPELNSKEDIKPVGDALVKLVPNKYPQVAVVNNEAMMEDGRKANLQTGVILLVFVFIISLISALNVVNTVATNIIVRKRELASLKAIGMTSKELKKMIYLEGILFGVYGGVVGCIIGTGISSIISKVFSQVQQTEFNLPWASMAIAMIAVILIGYVSAILPMRNLAKSNIIESIKEE